LPWFQTLICALLAALGAPASAQEDAARGSDLFQVCSACHSSEPGVSKLGPSLFGIVGRRAGTEPGFVYSEAMSKLDRVWTPQTLDAYLADPPASVPGTKMVYDGLKDAARRADLIAYLSSLQ
jgi:cytochrome c2